MSDKCLFCYQALDDNELNFHSSCAKKMFGSRTAPILELDNQRLESLAKEIVVKSIAVTGVQPKLSLQLEKQFEWCSEVDYCRYLWGLYFKTSISTIF